MMMRILVLVIIRKLIWMVMKAVVIVMEVNRVQIAMMMGKKGTELVISVLSEIADAFDGSFFSFLVETIRTK